MTLMRCWGCWQGKDEQYLGCFDDDVEAAFKYDWYLKELEANDRLPPGRWDLNFPEEGGTEPQIVWKESTWRITRVTVERYSDECAPSPLHFSPGRGRAEEKEREGGRVRGWKIGRGGEESEKDTVRGSREMMEGGMDAAMKGNIRGSMEGERGY